MWNDRRVSLRKNPEMGDGRWVAEYGPRKMENGRWVVEDGRWKVEDGIGGWGVRPVGPSESGNRVDSCRECVRSVLVMSLPDGFGTRLVSFLNQQSGDSKKQSPRMIHSSGFFRVVINVGLTV